MNDTPVKITYAEGCFDSVDFESQKELDAFKKTIEEAFNDPEFLKQNTIPLTEEEFKDLIKEKTILRH